MQSADNLLTIVIPCKNEVNFLPQLLKSLTMQDYQHITSVPIFIADNKSTDGTLDEIKKMSNQLTIKVVPGGMPSIGRNTGAKLTTSKYLLFIDADMVLDDQGLIRKTVEAMEKNNWHCATTNIKCLNNDWRANLLFAISNIAQWGSKFLSPYSSGMFMAFDRKIFFQLGGFNEKAIYAEDYELTKKVKVGKFGIVRGHILTSNRRFKKMGYSTIIKMFLNTILHSNDKKTFEKDYGYWEK